MNNQRDFYDTCLKLQEEPAKKDEPSKKDKNNKDDKKK